MIDRSTTPPPPFLLQTFLDATIDRIMDDPDAFEGLM